jgi:hypothetical protein
MFFLSALQTGSGPNQPTFQRVLEPLPPGIEWPAYEMDNLPTYSTKVKNMWNYTSIPQYVLMIWYLNTWDNFYHFQL